MKFIGVLHLPPLPGAVRDGPGFEAILDGAMRDAAVLAMGGADGLIVENLGDAPFTKGTVDPHVAAMLAIVARELKARFDLEVGVNALRNDGVSALGAAAAGGADFVRINVLSGVMATDQGLIEGDALGVAQYRKRVAPEVKIVADVLVKHAAPLAPVDLGQVAHDTFHRAGADVLVVTGSGTGQPTDLSQVATLRSAVPEAPVWVGSGVTGDTIAEVATLADGVIVGTWLHRDSDLAAPLDITRVRAIAARP